MPTMALARATWLESFAAWPLPAPPKQQILEVETKHLADGLDIALGGAEDGREGASDGTGLAARHGAVEGMLAAHLGGAGDIAGASSGALVVRSMR